MEKKLNPDSNYKAVKGDLVDELLAKYIKDCPVPVKRLGDGYYLFGTRKIYAKIMNGKLVVRVGGGYMIIEEFIATYAEPELIKLQKMGERGEVWGESSPKSTLNSRGSYRNS